MLGGFQKHLATPINYGSGGTAFGTREFENERPLSREEIAYGVADMGFDSDTGALLCDLIEMAWSEWAPYGFRTAEDYFSSMPKGVIGKSVGGKGLFSAEPINEDEVVTDEFPLMLIPHAMTASNITKQFKLLPKEAQRMIMSLPLRPNTVPAEMNSAARIAQIILNNGHELELPPFGSTIVALYPVLARATHSCSPNLEPKLDGVRLKLIATRPIGAYKRMHWAQIDILLPFAQRRAEHERIHGRPWSVSPRNRNYAQLMTIYSACVPW